MIYTQTSLCVVSLIQNFHSTSLDCFEFESFILFLNFLKLKRGLQLKLQFANEKDDGDRSIETFEEQNLTFKQICKAEMFDQQR